MPKSKPEINVERYLDAWELARLERDRDMDLTGHWAGADTDPEDAKD